MCHISNSMLNFKSCHMLTHSLPQMTTDKQTDKATSYSQMVHDTDLSWMKSTNMIFSTLTVHMGPPINMSGRQLEVVREWNGSWESQCCKNLPVIFVIIHLIVCLTTGPKPLPKRALHIVQSRASSFKWEYPLLSLRSSNSFLHLLPCLPVTSIPPCIFPFSNPL